MVGPGGNQRPGMRPSGCGRAETHTSEVSPTNSLWIWTLALASLSLSLGRDVTAPILQVLSDSGDLGESVPLSLAPLVVSISFWS